MVLRKLRRHIRIFLCTCSIIFVVIFLLLYNRLPQESNTRRGTKKSIRHVQSRATQAFCSQYNKTTIALDNENYPNCQTKLDWMKENWETHVCYSELGVDGTECSFYLYLGQIEQHCPAPFVKTNNIRKSLVERNHGLNDLLRLLSDSDVNFSFIKSRITRLFSKWTQGIVELQKRVPDLWRRSQLNVILYMGFLSHETGLKFGEKSSAGGPLGEMVQWADLIASIFLLGHNLTISSEWTSFKEKIDEYEIKGPCPQIEGVHIDYIFTDIMGLRRIKRKMKNFFLTNKCKFRILDSFGTHAEFNSNAYFKAHQSQIGGKNIWGGHELILQQFLTMYPHSDDNTFLGFVVETYDFNHTVVRKNITVVYGKEKYMWKDSERILQVAANYTEIHATVADSQEIMPEYHITNHHLLTGENFHDLLRGAKIFLGLGFPLEGPAPLEAIANGAIFINPKFIPPKSRKTYKFFADKPTLRELHSQNPYMERFIGSPYVFTVDVFNFSDLHKAFQSALQTMVPPYLPFEFSFLGMIERVDVILNKHNFCNLLSEWPPFEVASVLMAPRGMSCQDFCASKGFVCERTFFSRINNEEFLSTFSKCSGGFSKASVTYAPATCLLQNDHLLFSCATVPPKDIKRICPCRPYKKGQSILVH